MYFMKKFNGRHSLYIWTYQTEQITPECGLVGFDKPGLVWCKTNDQTAFSLTSTNAQFAKPVRNQTRFVQDKQT